MNLDTFQKGNSVLQVSAAPEFPASTIVSALRRVSPNVELGQRSRLMEWLSTAITKTEVDPRSLRKNPVDAAWLRQHGRIAFRFAASLLALRNNLAIHPRMFVSLLQATRCKTLLGEERLGLLKLSLEVPTLGDVSHFDQVRHIHYQLVGALSLSVTLEELLVLINDVYSPVYVDEFFSLSFVSILKRHVGKPVEFTCEMAGPEHNRKFSTQFIDEKGRAATGNGNTADEARTDCAKTYLEQYAPYLISRERRYLERSFEKRILAEPQPRDSRQLSAWRKVFDIPEDGLGMLTVALTSNRTARRLGLPAWHCNDSLAKVGLEALRAAISEEIIHLSEIHESANWGKSSLVERLDAVINSDSLHQLLKDKGLCERQSPTEAIAALSAAVAVRALCLPSRSNLREYLPQEIRDYIQRALLASLDVAVLQPPTTLAMILLQATEISCAFVTSPSETKHGEPSAYNCRVVFTCFGSTARLILDAGEAAYTRKHKSDTARQICKIVQSLHEDMTFAKTVLGQDTFLRLARFVFKQAFSCPPPDPRRAQAWRRLGLFGSRLIENAQTRKEFFQWAQSVDAIFADTQDKPPGWSCALDFYRAIPNHFAEKLYSAVVDAAMQIKAHGMSEDPWRWLVDVQGTPTFVRLQEVLRILSLAGRRRVYTSLKQVIEDLRLLNRTNEIDMSATLQDVTFLAKEGAVSELLRHLLTEAALVAGLQVRCVVDSSPSSANQIALLLRFDHARGLVSSVATRLSVSGKRSASGGRC